MVEKEKGIHRLESDDRDEYESIKQLRDRERERERGCPETRLAPFYQGFSIEVTLEWKEGFCRFSRGGWKDSPASDKICSVEETLRCSA